MNRKGVIPIGTVMMVVAGIAILAGVFYYAYQSALPVQPYTTAPGPVAAPAPTSTATTTMAQQGISPTSGAVGVLVTIHGSGFAATGNTVTMNGLTAASMKNRPSPDGKTITFTVPSSLGPNCKPNEMCAQFLVNLNFGSSYKVEVVTGNVIQDMGTFTVTGS